MVSVRSYADVITYFLGRMYYQIFLAMGLRSCWAPLLSGTTLNPSNDMVIKKIWIIPHSEKNIWIKEAFPGSFTFENTAVSRVLFAIYEQQR